MPSPENVSGSHERIIEAFKLSAEQDLRQTGFLLAQIKDLRVMADYKIDSSFSHAQAAQTIATAEEIRNIAQMTEGDDSRV